MEKNLRDTEAIEKLKKLAEDVRTCMYVTEGSEKDARPMYTIKVEEDGGIWFFTKDDKKIASEAGVSNTHLYYSHPGDNTYLSVHGTAVVVNDKQKMGELWSPMLKAWFPEGLEEPDMALLKVTPAEARYWDVDAAKIVELFAIAKAAITGKTTDMGEHGELKM